MRAQVMEDLIGNVPNGTGLQTPASTQGFDLNRSSPASTAVSRDWTWQYEAPQGEMEEALAGVWQEMLWLERVGRNDNFFELGGDSLLFARMLEHLRQKNLFGEVASIYEYPTVADLASVLTRGAVGQFEVPPNRIPLGCEAIT